MPNVIRLFTDFTYKDNKHAAPVDVVLEWNSRDASIVCNHCPNQPRWCRHILSAIRMRFDLPILWHEDYANESQELLLPIFPDTDQFTSIRLNPDGPDMKAIHWVDFRRISPHDPVPLIGSLQPGEGIAIIRTLMVEYMYLQFNITRTTPACKAAHHGLNAEKVWAAHGRKEDPKHLPELWSIFTSESCLYCATHDPSSEPSGEFPDDLVPASQSGWNRNP